MTDKEVSESVLRSIESHLRDNPMSYDIRESEDNFGEGQERKRMLHPTCERACTGYDVA
jgi:hypothetical protein